MLLQGEVRKGRGAAPYPAGENDFPRTPSASSCGAPALLTKSVHVLLLILLVSLCACAKKNYGPIADLSRLPQNLSVYADKAGKDKRLLAPAVQNEQAKKLRRLYFRPWDMKKADGKTRDVYWAYYGMKSQNAWNERSRKWSASAWEEIKDLSDVGGFPSRTDHGITVRNTSLRAMPTARAWYKNPELPGEGYPFDYLQHSALWVGAPVFVAHTSRDGKWLLVQTPMASGWVPHEHVALVDDEFKQEWRSAPLAAIIRDNASLPGGGKAYIGTLLPLPGPGGVLLPSTRNGKAVILRASMDPSLLTPVPLAATPGNVAAIGNSMMGQAYGWGGMDENRDCSALVRDLFAPFGIWLPRNSASQAASGRQTSLKGLSPSAKEQRIRQTAVPFLSLIWLPGHIGLYLGEYDGVPSIFHNVWGVRTTDLNGAGRAIIGKAAVTSLRPGAELPNVASPASILDRIERITTLP